MILEQKILKDQSKDHLLPSVTSNSACNWDTVFKALESVYTVFSQ